MENKTTKTMETKQDKNLELLIAAKNVKQSVDVILEKINEGQDFSSDFLTGFLEGIQKHLTIEDEK
jgi:hypothetical protein